jgi:hypothetical protein
MTDFVRFINLTPHGISLLRYFGRPDDPGWEIVDIEPSGTVVRVQEFQAAPNRGALPSVNGVECVCAPVDAGVHGLPEPVPGVAYVVSYRAARAVDRADVFAPDTGPESAVRGDDGQILYVRRLIASGGEVTHA